MVVSLFNSSKATYGGFFRVKDLYDDRDCYGDKSVYEKIIGRHYNLTPPGGSLVECFVLNF